jgi:hypothetical protein
VSDPEEPELPHGPTDAVFLTPEELELLTPDELDAYEQYLRATNEAWTLTPKQQLAEELITTGKVDLLGYGGAAGGGKSEWLLWHAYHLALRVPQTRCLLLRSVFPELRRSLIARSQQKFDQAKCRYFPGDKEWRFGNGSVIEFGYLDSDDDVYQYKSAEYDFIGFDEGTEFSEFAFDYLRSRARTPTWKYRLGARPHIAIGTNPGGPGHGWFKRRMVTPTNYGEDVIEVEVLDPITREVAGTRRTAFVPATLLDNPHIDPDYKLNLMMLPEVEMRQLLYGDWDTFSGQFFADWNNSLHVCRPFAIPTTWPRFRAIDYGYAAPFACLWFAVDLDGGVWAYREAYSTGLTATQQADRIVELSRTGGGRAEKIDYTVADPSVWAKQGTGVSIASQYRSRGVICKKAMNARVDGWSRVRDWLRPDPARGVTIDGTLIPQPQLRVFPACENLVRTLPDLVLDPDKPEDVKDGQEDHAADALRYGAMSRPRSSKPLIPGPADTSLEARMRQHLEQLGREHKRPVHEVLGRVHV